jgi:hypothetical protein
LPHHICKINKVLYGLNQAIKAWFSLLSGKLIELGFVGSKVDSSLLTYRSNSITLFILIYVDDIIIIASISFAIDEILQLLHINFGVKDLDDLNFFLRVEVCW